MFRVVVIALAIVALLLSGCQQAAQKAVEQTTGVKVDNKNESVTLTGKDGEKVTISSEVPEELKDFPFPSGFKLDSSGSMSSGDDKLSVASWKGKSTIKDASDFYKKTMPEKGWKETSSFMSGDGGLLNYDKGDLSVSVTFSQEKEEVNISVLLAKSKKTPTAAAGSRSTGGSTSSTATPSSSSDSSGGRATATPKAEATSTPAGPVLTDSSTLPQELKDFPIPSGFSVIKNSASRAAYGGKVSEVRAAWFGKSSLKAVVDFFKQSLPSKGWQEDYIEDGENNTYLSYNNGKEENRISLTIMVEKQDAGTEIEVYMYYN